MFQVGFIKIGTFIYAGGIWFREGSDVTGCSRWVEIHFLEENTDYVLNISIQRETMNKPTASKVSGSGINPERMKRWEDAMDELCLDGLIDTRMNADGEEMIRLTGNGEVIARAMLEQFGLPGKFCTHAKVNGGMPYNVYLMN